jgi:transposase
MLVARHLRGRQLLPFISQLPTCLVGMEAYCGANYWAREIGKLGARSETDECAFSSSLGEVE